jgi:hypothetical protein
MRKLFTAAAFAASLMVTGALFAQDSPAQRRDIYQRYGGPSEIPAETPGPAVGLKKLPSISGVVNEAEEVERIKQRNREAAVAFGSYRSLFAGSTRFLMDYNRTQQPKHHFSMGDLIWNGIHPADENNYAGYTYSTATVLPGSPVMPAEMLMPLDSNGAVFPISVGAPAVRPVVQVVRPAVKTAATPAPAQRVIDLNTAPAPHQRPAVRKTTFATTDGDD